jgi:hypothetical protein
LSLLSVDGDLSGWGLSLERKEYSFLVDMSLQYAKAVEVAVDSPSPGKLSSSIGREQAYKLKGAAVQSRRGQQGVSRGSQGVIASSIDVYVQSEAQLVSVALPKGADSEAFEVCTLGETQ